MTLSDCGAATKSLTCRTQTEPLLHNTAIIQVIRYMDEFFHRRIGGGGLRSPLLTHFVPGLPGRETHGKGKNPCYCVAKGELPFSAFFPLSRLPPALKTLALQLAPWGGSAAKHSHNRKRRQQQQQQHQTPAFEAVGDGETARGGRARSESAEAAVRGLRERSGRARGRRGGETPSSRGGLGEEGQARGRTRRTRGRTSARTRTRTSARTRDRARAANQWPRRAETTGAVSGDSEA